MNRFMAAGRPTRSLLQAHGVIRAPDENRAVADLLEMTFKTEIRITHGEQLGVDAAVGGMTGGAAFAHRFVFKNIRAALGRMAFQTVVILRQQGGTATGTHTAFVR